MPNTRASTNHILKSLPREDAKLVESAGTFVLLPLRQVLQTPDIDIEHCYFVESGLVSAVAVLSDGDPLEVGVIGPEGLVGLPALLGAKRSPTELLVQMTGSALRIESEALRGLFERSAPLRQALLRYVQAMHVQVSQTAACNGRHDAEQRLARWLLMVDDKVTVKPMQLTQEFLSMMLGVRRQQVSIAATALQRAGFIAYRHGSVEVVDRAGLESAACECYGIVAREFRRLV